MQSHKLELYLNDDLYKGLMNIANQLDMEAFTLIRKLIEYTVAEYN